MKLMHISDLHLGKNLNGFSLLEDQAYILNEIIKTAEAKKPQAVIIAGDVYDKPMPPIEAVNLLDDFLVKLSRMNLQVFMISGNHDSADRVAFGSRLMELSGIHIAPAYDGEVKPIVISDEHGEVRVYMLPFVRPTHVRRYFEEAEIETYTDALRTAIEQMRIDTDVRNILVTHQFVTNAVRSESEDISVGGENSVGGVDNVDASVFEGFDYVALGHLHKPQYVGRSKQNTNEGVLNVIESEHTNVGDAEVYETVEGTRYMRYCGTPLKYSFSEAKDEKSITVVETEEKGSVKVREIPLKPLRDMVELRGSYMEVTEKSYYEGTSYKTDYVHITLTDEEDIPDAIAKLRSIYTNIMKLDYDNTRTSRNVEITVDVEAEKKNPQELFSDFYQLQNNAPMSAEQESYLSKLIEQIWEVNE